MSAPVTALVERYVRQHLRGRPHDGKAAHDKCVRWSLGLIRFLRKHGRRPALYVIRDWAPGRRPRRSSEWVGDTYRRVRTAPKSLRADRLYSWAFSLNSTMFRHLLVFCDGYWIDLTVRQFDASIMEFKAFVAALPAVREDPILNAPPAPLWWPSELLKLQLEHGASSAKGAR
jgi:hypothetical protein